jgi:hypothetical protein
MAREYKVEQGEADRKFMTALARVISEWITLNGGLGADKHVKSISIELAKIPPTSIIFVTGDRKSRNEGENDNRKKVSRRGAKKTFRRTKKKDSIHLRRVHKLGLEQSLVDALQKANIQTVSAICKLTAAQLKEQANLGQSEIKSIRETLRKLGVRAW